MPCGSPRGFARQSPHIAQPLILAPKLSIIIDGGGRLTPRRGNRRYPPARRCVRRNDHYGCSLLPARKQTAKRDRIAGRARRSSRPSWASGKPCASWAAAPVPGIIDAAACEWHLRSPEVDARSARANRTCLADRASMILAVDRARSRSRPSFGQIHARDLRHFLRRWKFSGQTEIRLAPGHALMVLGIAPDRIAAGAGTGAAGTVCGPFRAIRAITLPPAPGIGACASALIDTRTAGAGS